VAIAGRGGLIGVHCGVFCSRREVIHYKIEQMVGANVAQSGGKEHRKNPVFFNSFMQRWNQVFFGDGPLIKELFHQLVFALGNNFHQLLMGFFGCGLKVTRLWAWPAVAQTTARRASKRRVIDPPRVPLTEVGEIIFRRGVTCWIGVRPSNLGISGPLGHAVTGVTACTIAGRPPAR
jgi:hypothetical protein